MAKRSVQMVVGTDARIRYLDHGDNLDLPGTVTRSRASHVEPVNWLFRFFFHLIRRRVDDGSEVAEWVRRWPCLWRANLTLSGGPISRPYRSRRSAIEWEEKWLLENGFGTGGRVISIHRNDVG